jgi:hypothetical protein
MTAISRAQYERAIMPNTNPAANRHYVDAPDIKGYLDKVWREYVEESYHEGTPVSVEDFGLYLESYSGGFER